MPAFGKSSELTNGRGPRRKSSVHGPLGLFDSLQSLAASQDWPSLAELILKSTPTKSPVASSPRASSIRSLSFTVKVRQAAPPIPWAKLKGSLEVGPHCRIPPVMVVMFLSSFHFWLRL